VFHACEPWIRQESGGAEGEGANYVISEFKYLLKHAFWRVPDSLLRTAFWYGVSVWVWPKAGFMLFSKEN
jgi:rhamnosyltransferase